MSGRFHIQELSISKLRIRQAKEADLHELIRVENICFDRYYRAHRFDLPQFARYIRLSTIFVATDETSLKGYISGIIRPPIAHIDSIAVMPEVRQEGIGRRLMQKFIREAKQRGCKRITLEIAVANEVGRAFFEKLGFHEYRRVHSYYGPKVDALKMGCQL